MTRAETLAAINALPVSDAVKAHAARLIEGLPEWCPLPHEQGHLLLTARYYAQWVKRREDLSADTLTITVDDDRGAPIFAYESKKFPSRQEARGGPITDRDVHELLRQFSGMVALTRGG
jgi:hypothetical protein